MTQQPTPIEIDYATPSPRGPRILAAAAIVLAALALVALGGCFLIGVMMTIEKGFTAIKTPPPLTMGEKVFVGFLVGLALVAFAAAVWLLIIGIRALLRVIRM